MQRWLIFPATFITKSRMTYTWVNIITDSATQDRKFTNFPLRSAHTPMSCFLHADLSRIPMELNSTANGEMICPEINETYKMKIVHK